jgi:chromosome condensin MukBEF MukE localization factor
MGFVFGVLSRGGKVSRERERDVLRDAAAAQNENVPSVNEEKRGDREILVDE